LFKSKTIIKHRLNCCRYDDKFEDERAQVQELLEELSVQLSLENLQKVIKDAHEGDAREARKANKNIQEQIRSKLNIDRLTESSD
jgi:hypothetical protein